MAGHARGVWEVVRGEGLHWVGQQHGGVHHQLHHVPPYGGGWVSQHQCCGAQRGAQASLLVNHLLGIITDALSRRAFKLKLIFRDDCSHLKFINGWMSNWNLALNYFWGLNSADLSFTQQMKTQLSYVDCWRVPIRWMWRFGHTV